MDRATHFVLVLVVSSAIASPAAEVRILLLLKSNHRRSSQKKVFRSFQEVLFPSN